MGQVPRAPSTSHQGSLHFLYLVCALLPYSLTCPPSRWAELPVDACPLPCWVRLSWEPGQGVGSFESWPCTDVRHGHEDSSGPLCLQAQDPRTEPRADTGHLIYPQPRGPGSYPTGSQGLNVTPKPHSFLFTVLSIFLRQWRRPTGGLAYAGFPG